MQCKWCGQEMLKGYIQCIDGVYWDEKKRTVARGLVSPSAVKLGEDSPNPFTGGYVVAYRCPKCKKIVIDY